MQNFDAPLEEQNDVTENDGNRREKKTFINDSSFSCFFLAFAYGDEEKHFYFCSDVKMRNTPLTFAREREEEEALRASEDSSKYVLEKNRTATE